jgi:hypothetical protein
MSETGFSLGDIQSLSNLLNGTENDDVDENQFYSNETKSTLNPGNINGKEKKRNSTSKHENRSKI